MSDKFTLLTFSFCVMLHNVCSWTVSEPLNHTFNGDDSVSVTCMVYGDKKFQMEAKLKMNNEYVCHVYNKSQVQDTNKNDCTWHHEDDKFTFTLMKPKDLFSNTFSCEISRIKPFPVEKKEGPKIKLFRSCNTNFYSCPNTFTTNTENDKTVKTEKHEEVYILIICGLIIVVALLSLYGIIITALFIRLRGAKPESSDTLTYVPMQRNVKRRELENTEYVDMREVQKRGGSHRDMNHNSHIATA